MNSNSGTIIRKGLFSIGSHHGLAGELSLQGSNSMLHVWFNDSSDLDITNDQYFAQKNQNQTPGDVSLPTPTACFGRPAAKEAYSDLLKDQDIINGVLDNGEKVSLITCTIIDSNNAWSSTNTFINCKFFPHYIILGHDYLCSSDEVIIGVSLKVDDEYTIFDYNNLIRTSFIKSNQLEELNYLKMSDEVKFPKKNDLTIVCLADGLEIFSVDTIIGRISVYNGSTIKHDYSGRNSTGIYMGRNVSINIKFINSLNIDKMCENIDKILRFIEIISGRPQNLLKIKIAIQENELKQLSVYLNTYPGRTKHSENPNPSHRDVLINAANKPDQFASLIFAWLERDQDEIWRIARHRFSDVWNKQGNYDPDRIVAAANMFDLLPRSIFPQEIELPREFTDAVQKSKEIFKKLPNSPQRDSILTYLGQIKKPSLKQKIRYRSQIIKTVIKNDLEKVDYVIDEAVELRHFYVHGDKPDGRRKKLIQFTPFLTNTLEFVFCVSDLIELGWDFLSWYRKSKSKTHPLSIYIHYEYPSQWRKFLTYLEEI